MANYKNSSDFQLSDLLKSSDHAAFTEIYNRYWALLFRHARGMLRDDNDAGDVVQEVFTYLWSKRDNLFLTHSLSSYLYSAVRHKTLNVIKRSKVKDKYMESLGKFQEAGSRDPDEDLIMKELTAKIEAGIAQIPLKMRRIFELSRKEHLSHKEIAEQLGIADSTVKKQISRAIKILRLRLQLIIISVFIFFL